jgi:threonyl-tRNA synthetase
VTYIGEDSVWDIAEKNLEDALIANKLNYTMDIGGGAYYGPKIDVKVFDCYGREHQIGKFPLGLMEI